MKFFNLQFFKYYKYIIKKFTEKLSKTNIKKYNKQGEETPNAEVVAPRAIIGGLLIT